MVLVMDLVGLAIGWNGLVLVLVRGCVGGEIYWMDTTVREEGELVEGNFDCVHRTRRRAGRAAASVSSNTIFIGSHAALVFFDATQLDCSTHILYSKAPKGTYPAGAPLAAVHPNPFPSSVMMAPRDDSNASANAFPITEAQLTGHYFETLGYGMYLATCCLCAQTLFWIPQPGGGERLRRRSEIRWLLISVFFFLFVVSTFDDIIGLVHMILAFVKYQGPGGAKGELTNIHEWIHIVRSFDQIGIMIVGDFVLIYRCFVVYGRRWPAIAVSFMLYLAGIAMGIKLINAAITLNSNVIKPWWSAFFAITAAQNVLTTSLLVWRIWRVEHRNAKLRASRDISLSAPVSQPRLRKVIRVVTESGLAYSTLVFVTFVALQATGITFNVIIIRSTPRREDEFIEFAQTERGIAGRAFSGLQFISHATATADQGNTMEIVNINVTIKSTTDRLDDGELQVDAYSTKNDAAKIV
ncbi:hypothetical protein K438DRAFT_1936197 [Mycena galopus ATCC 62051]|nr:hypothetical protein K438DRAFT_1936197 [Mycena galopus ATCC 62051]